MLGCGGARARGSVAPPASATSGPRSRAAHGTAARRAAPPARRGRREIYRVVYSVERAATAEAAAKISVSLRSHEVIHTYTEKSQQLCARGTRRAARMQSSLSISRLHVITPSPTHHCDAVNARTPAPPLGRMRMPWNDAIGEYIAEVRAGVARLRVERICQISDDSCCRSAHAREEVCMVKVARQWRLVKIRWLAERGRGQHLEKSWTAWAPSS